MQTLRTSSAAALLAAAASLLLLLAGCSGMSGGMTGGQYTLTFVGDSSFNGPHGGQPIHVALVNADTGKVVAKQSGTVSRTADPAFTFTFDHALSEKTHYDVDYWIDSNFGGGTLGVCDDKKHDHQWNVKVGEVHGDVQLLQFHHPEKTSPVCDVFQKM